MAEYLEYPRWLYGPAGTTVIVQDREGEDALGEGWSHFPPEGASVGPVATADAPAPVVALTAIPSDEMQVWLDRATAVNLRVDRRWGPETLQRRVEEAESLARA